MLVTGDVEKIHHTCMFTPRNRITKIVLFRLCMIVFPPGRMWMLNKDGSKWKHIASAVENSKVVMMKMVVGRMLKLMRRRRNFKIRMEMKICWLWSFHEIEDLKTSEGCLSISSLVWQNCLQYEDWFLLRQMSKNVDSETFAEFLRSLNMEEDLGNNNNNHR